MEKSFYVPQNLNEVFTAGVRFSLLLFFHNHVILSEHVKGGDSNYHVKYQLKVR